MVYWFRLLNCLDFTMLLSTAKKNKILCHLLETCMIHLQNTGLGWCTCRRALWACGWGTCSAGIRRDPRRADTGWRCSSACRSVDHSRGFRRTRQTLVLRWSRSSLRVWRWMSDKTVLENAGAKFNRKSQKCMVPHEKAYLNFKQYAIYLQVSH